MSSNTESNNFKTLNLTMVVKDIYKTSQYLSSLLGIGPWEKMEYAPDKNDMIVGKPFKLKFAFAQLGSIVLQLTQPIEGESPWKKFLDENGEGLHNIFFEVPDWDETIKRYETQESKILASGILEGKRWCLFKLNMTNFRVEIGER